MAEVKDRTDARQGSRGRHVLWILIISTAMAALLAFFAYSYVFTADNETLRDEIPQTNEVSEGEGGGG